MIGDVLVNLRYLQAFRQKLPEDSQLDIYSDLNSEVMTGLLYKKSFVHAVFTGNDLDSGQYDLIIRLIRFSGIAWLFGKYPEERVIPFFWNISR